MGYLYGVRALPRNARGVYRRGPVFFNGYMSLSGGSYPLAANHFRGFVYGGLRLLRSPSFLSACGRLSVYVR